MDDQLDIHRVQSGFELGPHGIATPAFAGSARLGFQFIHFAQQLVWVADRNHQINAWHLHQMPAYDAAKITVPTDHHHPERHSTLPETI
ncbi:hypothetical protein D9M71_684070 [compost metagenome]